MADYILALATGALVGVALFGINPRRSRLDRARAAFLAASVTGMIAYWVAVML
jgi:hypothetical protein